MERWWSEHDLVNGVFKGGGAKGIAYAGALEAMSRRRMWFGSVAGTSAGSITAALIAAGYAADQMTAEVPDLLQAIKRSRIRMLLGLRATLFDGARLRVELEELFARSVDRKPDLSSPVTFRELYDKAGGITLYVLALDLSRASPVVFSVHTTPTLSVSAAVMASSAIPVGFPSIRAVFKVDKKIWVQRLVDGGAWANLPRFVYYDPSFSSWLIGINKVTGTDIERDVVLERSRRLICFALGMDDTTIIRPETLTLNRRGGPQYDRGTMTETENGLQWTISRICSGPILRLVAFFGLAVLALVLLLNLNPAIANAWSIIGSSSIAHPLLTPLLGALYGLGVFLGCGVPMALLAVSKPVGDVLVPSAKAALAAGMGVAPWVGSANDDHLIRLDPGKLSTSNFKPSLEDQRWAIRDARLRTLRYIDERLHPQSAGRSPIELQQAFDAAVDEQNQRRTAQEKNAQPQFGSHYLLFFTLVSIFAGLGLSQLILAVAYSDAFEEYPAAIFIYGIPSLAISFFLFWISAKGWATWNSLIARGAVTPTRRFSWYGAVLSAIGIGLLGGAACLAIFTWGHAPKEYEVTVTEIIHRDNPDGYQDFIRFESAGKIDAASSEAVIQGGLHPAVGQRVAVTTQTDLFEPCESSRCPHFYLQRSQLMLQLFFSLCFALTAAGIFCLSAASLPFSLFRRYRLLGHSKGMLRPSRP